MPVVERRLVGIFEVTKLVAGPHAILLHHQPPQQIEQMRLSGLVKQCGCIHEVLLITGVDLVRVGQVSPIGTGCGNH